ncbi:hypothetical protein IJJ54_01380 [Candidatus Saccharibacteria bacterium]|nr:hypothetical protein [Candidatus Saccharibacteria bacterium]
MDHQSVSIFRLLHPFSDDECLPSNPDSSLSCNQSASPSVLFNDASEEKTMWGHDGEGIAFTDETYLITESDGSKNWQYRTAKPGDKIDISLKMAGERYFDVDNTKPVLSYAIGAYIPDYMSLDKSSIVVKVGDQIIPSSNYQLVTASASDLEIDGVSEAFVVRLEWAKSSNNTFRSFNYADGNPFEVLFSVNISEDASDTLGVKAISDTSYLDNGSVKELYFDEGNTAPDAYKAKVLLSGNIMIRRLNENDQPVHGATYVVDGVKATKIKDGFYQYSANGNVEEFATDETGTIVISKVPFGRYSATETSVPSGIEAKNLTLTRDLSVQLQKLDYGTSYAVERVPNTGIKETDITDLVMYRADGRMVVDANRLYGLMFGGSDQEYVFSYDESTGEYTASDGSKIVKTENGYDVTAKMGTTQMPRTVTRAAQYDEALGKYYVDYSVAEMDPEAATQHYFIPNGQTGSLHGANNLSATLTLDESTGCYAGTYSSQSLKLCPEDDGYQETWGGIGITLAFDSANNRYAPKDDHAISIIIDDVQPTAINAVMGTLLRYSSSFDKYFMAGAEGAAQFPVKYGPAKTLAALYLFDNNARDESLDPDPIEEPIRTEGDDVVVPDSISNPQTSDAILKILVITLLGIVPSFVLRKQLIRRSR